MFSQMGFLNKVEYINITISIICTLFDVYAFQEKVWHNIGKFLSKINLLFTGRYKEESGF